MANSCMIQNMASRRLIHVIHYLGDQKSPKREDQNANDKEKNARNAQGHVKNFLKLYVEIRLSCDARKNIWKASKNVKNGVLCVFFVLYLRHYFNNL